MIKDNKKKYPPKYKLTNDEVQFIHSLTDFQLKGIVNYGYYILKNRKEDDQPKSNPSKTKFTD